MNRNKLFAVVNTHLSNDFNAHVVSCHRLIKRAALIADRMNRDNERRGYLGVYRVYKWDEFAGDYKPRLWIHGDPRDCDPYAIECED